MSDKSSQELFNEALDLRPEERKAYLEANCKNNHSLQKEVLELLACHDQSESFLDVEPPALPTIPFNPPDSIQQYRIAEKIGEGSMGIVFKAEDTKLNRSVAIKFLKRDTYLFPERIDRFKREAESLAGVNSPCIATIHDWIETKEVSALVLEYLEGENLQQHLDRQTMTIEEAIRIATLLCEGLIKAHQKGIVHRDLKPSNIILTPDQGLKILDFGLAKVPPLASSSEETQAGTIFGTPAYMSPEQAKGESASFASDLWSLGCILFEMLAAKHPYKTSNNADTVANILKFPPPWESLPSKLPPSTLYLLRQCLQKNPEARLNNASAAHALLSASMEEIYHPAPVSETGLQTHARSRLKPLSLSTVSLFIGFLIGGWLAISSFSPGRSPDEKATKISLKAPIQLGPRLDRSRLYNLSLSPNGSQLVYANSTGLWYQNLTTIDPPQLLSRNRTQEPFWNPESNAIAYLEGSTLYAHSLENNHRSVVVELPNQMTPNHGGGAWLPDNTLRFNTGDYGLMQIKLHQDNTLTTLLPISEQDDNFHETTGLPDGRGLLFVTHHRNRGIDTISVWTPEKQRKDIFTLPGKLLGYPVYSQSGYILFGSLSPQSNLQSARIWAFPFSLEHLEKTGPKFLVEENAAFAMTLSANDTLVHSLPNNQTTQHRLTWLDNPVSEARHPERGFLRDTILSLSISPDESKAAFLVADKNSVQAWIHDFEFSTSHLIKTPTTLHTLSPLLWKDNNHLIYTTWETDGFKIWIDAIDKTTSPKKISAGIAVEIVRGTKTQLLIQGLPKWGHHSLLELDEPETQPYPLGASLKDMWAPKASPTGEYVAYVKGEQRKDSNIYVSNFPGGHLRFIVNKNLAAGQPFWHPTENVLYFISPTEDGHQISSVSLSDQGSIQISEPKKEGMLPESTFLGTPHIIKVIDYHSARKKFLFVEDQSPTELGDEYRGNALLTPSWLPNTL